jgi:hypothetical protein
MCLDEFNSRRLHHISQVFCEITLYNGKPTGIFAHENESEETRTEVR